VLDVPTMVARKSAGPARLRGLPAGTLDRGAAADIALVDLEPMWKVEPARFRSKSRNTPFKGWDLRGAVVAVLVDGRLRFDQRPTLRVAS